MADILTGWQGIAGTAIIISIILSGIALGLGRAFSFKRLERFGADEIMQAVINSAILGFVVALSAMVVQVGAEFTPQMGNITCFTYYNATTNTTIELNATALTPPDYVLCGLNATAANSSALTSDMIRIENNIGYYQTLSLHFGNLSIQPLVNLDSVSTQLSNSMYLIQFSTFASAMNAQFLSFVSSGWFGTIFAAGLVLRSFFLSRKFGAFLIAVAIGLIIFYPLMIMMFQPPLEYVGSTQNLTATFLNNTDYQTVPIIDLNDNSAVADKLYTLGFTGGNDYVGDLTVITQQTTGSASSLFFYLVIVPIFALIATGVLIKELSGSFAGEIATEVSQL